MTLGALAMPRRGRVGGGRIAAALGRLGGTARADRLLPPSRGVAWALGAVAAVLALGAVVALALALAGTRLAAGTAGDVPAAATLAILADEAEVEAQARSALAILADTPGVQAVRVIEPAEQRALLAPWLGTEVAVEGLTLPLMMDVTVDRAALDADALRARLAAGAPAATFEDHGAWRAPMLDGGARLARAGWVAAALAALAVAAAAGLAAAAVLGVGREAAAVLLLAGARDRFLAAICARRAARAAGLGAAVGAGAAVVLLARAGTGVPLELGLSGTELLLAPAVVAGTALAAAAGAWTTALAQLRRIG